MNSHKLAIKLFVHDDVFTPEEFVPILHRWIQTHALPNHLLIDVANYAHVPAGPGTLLVASEANIHLDRGENQLGLLYVRKMPLAGAETFADILTGVLRETLVAAALLEQDPALNGRLKFRTDEIAIRVNDRLNAPNTEQTLTDVRPEIEQVASKIFPGEKVRVEGYRVGTLTPFEVRLHTSGKSPVNRLLDRSGVSRPEVVSDKAI